MAFLLHQARFFTTVNHLRDLPATPQPEIAFAGRSNAGKSTAINVLCNQKQLAFASKTPGRTQHINYFSVGPADEPVAHVVDLPGYGYAEVPGAAKAHWEALLSTYLQSRAQLRGMILMMDARRPLTELDRRMIEWFAPTGKPIHALLTKCDKLTRQECVNTLRAAQKGFAEYKAAGYRGELSAQLFSSLKRIGLDEAHVLIESWLIPGESSVGVDA
ncbi:MULTISPECIES: ribosome biogenesis GTP-binding protein YihA/YsxC [Paraburkholderia]|uniref:Probable GTP-binding protein EngB n=1 Tax=Paraburkholderia megapolitana TaxID=420953 RepID=A0A1I3V8D8_9BURK|nr:MULTISPECIES: ribosome biogenesis GTP-binding protein YihA/YsxC [Paraburkholderia]MCX4165742.1 ribosome biogenesis GTP-binding protein YihA/YsxC [Paraburkholderia megapolitana]MDN7161233.1 ribosome biogenesis GTP-binding protein YihA/YsxC [Paraburkholderia sp. CHISQ3]MDQ6498280.1 ribosome biogenesis GTP-binding protein YihA/YsxC [Paraburkholderia megapolitana]QDQ85554.1 YihA family ribosome biogenesis GTP-binding protein [Paraburkholderia megapolitana]SFJ91249.1 cell division checkpoint GTP